ncbi:ATP-binding protein [Streptomyces sp. HU2014]|uniref:ATP-binding region ATPase domain-containing protein n=1 Tax=Streptomyces albireticuli TaxID=1940 RepID=A0A1Z2L4V3_9ACTN|nr:MULTISPECIES: ATP-binding protein [Streptomyces]ARZ69333.1 ATP-binding region ATPase domain-containing protein [Streptomyces albireticuli]UQI42967.1 ATP-binding protein [Streptomyces sp. HU2014]
MGDDPEQDDVRKDDPERADPEQADDWEYTLQVPRDPLAPCIARRTLRTIFQQHGFAAVADTAELLTSELLTNAYRYSDGPASVRVKGEGERVRVSVWDTNPKLPAPVRAAPPDGEAEQGRGLGLVMTCADSWGGFALRDQPQGLVGKLMWFELGGGH